MADTKPDQPLEPGFPEENGIFATYDLHCHCGLVRIRMTLSPPLFAEQTQGKEQYPVTSCACSHCERHGALMVHPLAKNVGWVQGRDQTIEYRMASKKNPHFLCSKCGCLVCTDIEAILKDMFGQGAEPRYAVNCRMLKDFEPSKLKVERDETMKDFGPKYEV